MIDVEAESADELVQWASDAILMETCSRSGIAAKRLSFEGSPHGTTILQTLRSAE